ncbi:hypothetical protein [Methylobacterium sp. A54F]
MPDRRAASERPPRGAPREPVPDEGRIDLPVARRRLLGLFAAAAVFIAGIVFTLASGAGPVAAVVLVGGGAFFGLGALAALRDLLRRGPVVSVSAHGILDRRLSTDWIPWSALDHVSEAGIGAQAFLRLHPRADRDATLPWTRRARLTARLNRILGGGYWVPGQGVQGGIPAILNAMAQVRGRRRR